MSPRLIGIELNPGPVPANIYGISPSVPTKTYAQELKEQVERRERRVNAQLGNKLRMNRFRVPKSWMTPKADKPYTPYLEKGRKRKQREKKYDFLGPIDKVYRPQGYSGKFGRVGKRKPVLSAFQEEDGPEYLNLASNSLEQYLKKGIPLPKFKGVSGRKFSKNPKDFIFRKPTRFEKSHEPHHTYEENEPLEEHEFPPSLGPFRRGREPDYPVMVRPRNKSPPSQGLFRSDFEPLNPIEPRKSEYPDILGGKLVRFAPPPFF